MRTYFSITNYLLIIILIFTNINGLHSNAYRLAEKIELTPVPVEKKKPKKKKRTKRIKKKIKKTSYYSDDTVIVVFSVLFMAVLIAGAIIFGVAMWHIIPFILSIIFLAVGNLGSIMGFVDLIQNGLDGVSVAPFFFFLFFFLFDLIAGLYFLIWGLLIAVPMAWLAGLALLILFAIILATFLVVLFNS